MLKYNSEITRRLMSSFGLFFFYYKNNSNSKYLIDSIEMTKLLGYEICPPFVSIITITNNYNLNFKK